MKLCRNALGVAFEKGAGCDRDPAAALKSYKAAAMLGLASAQFHYALLLSQTHGCSPM